MKDHHLPVVIGPPSEQQPQGAEVFLVQPAGLDQPPMLVPLMPAADPAQTDGAPQQIENAPNIQMFQLNPPPPPPPLPADQEPVQANVPMSLERILERLNLGHATLFPITGFVGPACVPPMTTGPSDDETPYPDARVPGQPPPRPAKLAQPSAPPAERHVVIPEFFQDGSRPLELSKAVVKPPKSKKNKKKSKAPA